MDLFRVRIEKLMCELDARCKMRSQKELEEKIIHDSINAQNV